MGSWMHILGYVASDSRPFQLFDPVEIIELSMPKTTSLYSSLVPQSADYLWLGMAQKQFESHATTLAP